VATIKRQIMAAYGC